MLHLSPADCCLASKSASSASSLNLNISCTGRSASRRCRSISSACPTKPLTISQQLLSHTYKTGQDWTSCGMLQAWFNIPLKRMRLSDKQSYNLPSQSQSVQAACLSWLGSYLSEEENMIERDLHAYMHCTASSANYPKTMMRWSSVSDHVKCPKYVAEQCKDNTSCLSVFYIYVRIYAGFWGC